MEKERRRGGGFDRLGRVKPHEIGLPRREAKRLLLEHAWRAVAGGALASRVRPSRVFRGILEVGVSDGRWEKVVRPMLPALAGRLAREFPDLGVRKFRLKITGTEEPSAPERVVAGLPSAGEGARLQEIPTPDRGPRSEERRIEDVAASYLARARERARRSR